METPKRTIVYDDELGALLALMPDIDPEAMTDRDLQTLLAFYQPLPGLWGSKQERLRQYFVCVDQEVFARVRGMLRERRPGATIADNHVA